MLERRKHNVMRTSLPHVTTNFWISSTRIKAHWNRWILGDIPSHCPPTATSGHMGEQMQFKAQREHTPVLKRLAATGIRYVDISLHDECLNVCNHGWMAGWMTGWKGLEGECQGVPWSNCGDSRRDVWNQMTWMSWMVDASF